jgi:hypothetical protein
MSCPFHIPQFDDPNNICSLVQIMKPIIIQFYPSPSHFLPFRPEPYHQRPVFSDTLNINSTVLLSVTPWNLVDIYQRLPVTQRTRKGSYNPRCYKEVPLRAWDGPEDSRKLRFPDFVTTAQVGGKIVNLKHRRHLTPGNTPGTHFY